MSRFKQVQRITAGFDTLMSQAPSTIALYLGDAVEKIDGQFGDGYADEHPELVGQFIIACSNDLSASLIAQQITSALDSISVEIKQRSNHMTLNITETVQVRDK